MQELKINKTYEDLIPPLSDEEFAQLEASIKAEGLRDAIVVLPDNTIIDGHNRYTICKRNGIEFHTVTKSFDSDGEIQEWIIRNQLGRRNISAYVRGILALKLKPVLAEAAKENSLANLKQGNKNPDWANSPDREKENIPTREVISKVANIGSNTLSRIEKLEACADEETKQKLRNNEISINEAYNAIRLKEKRAEIQKAEQDIAKQADETTKPVLFLGNGIGHKPTEKYDLLLTDPPYSTDVENIENFANSWLYTALDGVKDTGFAYVFIGAYPEELRAYLNAKTPEHIKLSQVLVWTYKNTLGNNPKDRYKQNYQACLFFRGINAPALDCPITNEQWAVQEINAPDGRLGDRYHTWQKPMEIAERFVRHSTQKGMTVFDPFACTGTFLLAAAKLGRKSYGYEINKDNADIAYSRGCVNG